MKYCSSGRKPVERAANGIRILVVGAGPSGLSTGYHLALGYGQHKHLDKHRKI